MNQDKVAFLLFLPPDLKKRLGMKKLETNKTMQDLIIEAIEDSL